MAKVRKLNRVLTVNDNVVETYLKQGYDEIDNSGKVIKGATAGKSVSVVEFNKLNNAFQELSAKHDKLTIEHNELKENGSLELTNAQIRSILEELGIEFGAKDNKNALMELLTKATDGKE